MAEKKDETADTDPVRELYIRLLKDRKQLRRVLLAEARCDHGCLLLHIFGTPHGLAWGRLARTLRTEPTLNPNDPDGPMLEQPRISRGTNAGLAEQGAVPTACKHIDYVAIYLDHLNLGTPGNPTVNIYRRG